MDKTIPVTVSFEKGSDLDLMHVGRRAFEQVINALLDDVCDEAAKSQGIYRNGYRQRVIKTVLGTLTFQVPKLRFSYYDPSDVLGRYTRSDKALMCVVQDLYVNGLSTRKIERLAQTLGIDRLSSSAVSEICRSLDEEVEAFVNENLQDCEIPYIWLDGTYIKVRDKGLDGSACMVVAVGVDAEGTKRILGFECVDTESYDAWKGFLERLRDRVIKGTKLVISDAHAGLKRAISEVFLGASWQRCTFHLIKNVTDKITSRCAKRFISQLMSSIFQVDNPQDMRARYHAVIQIVEKFSKSAAELMEEAEVDALAFINFPQSHWKRIRTNNVCERMNREIKRRTKVVQVFPSHLSLRRLVGAVLIEIDRQAKNRAFMSKASIDELYDEREMLRRQQRVTAWLGPIPKEVVERNERLIQAQFEQLRAA